MNIPSIVYDHWLGFLERLDLSQPELAVFHSAYQFLFETGILSGPTKKEPHLNISHSEAFKQIVDPQLPSVLRISLGCFLTAELALIDDGELAESVESVCWMSEKDFEDAIQRAPDRHLLNLPEFKELYARIRQLEGGSESGSEIALAY